MIDYMEILVIIKLDQIFLWHKMEVIYAKHTTLANS